MNLKTTLIAVLLFFLTLTGVSLLLFRTNTNSNPNTTTSSSNIPLETSPTSFSWGEIPLKGGDVTHTFTIKNTDAKKPLHLFDINTSCMCTTAYLEKDGHKSPLFGMHTKSSYQMTLNPGEIAQLHVIFDPAYHGPQGLGPITRFVTLKTNSSLHPELTFTVTATVRNQ